jgi:putative NIF3 family GTP cyclohydrolase 1 type 2
MTAQDVVTRIQQKLASAGIAWRATTVDTFKAGRPETAVRGIATTGMATLDVLRQASSRGRNFVITHEPTFYNHLDQTSGLEQDTTYQAKLRFIQEQGLVVWRFHDHAHMLRPDPLVVGSARVLGLTQYAAPGERNIYVVPPTTLRALAEDVARRTGGRDIRVCGDPDMKVTRIALGPGYGVPPLTQAIDVAIGGEAPESGGQAAYALDAQALGHARGVILLGHMMSEDFGMREVAEWLRGFVTDVPIEWIAAGEPFGAPRA